MTIYDILLEDANKYPEINPNGSCILVNLLGRDICEYYDSKHGGCKYCHEYLFNGYSGMSSEMLIKYIEANRL